MTYKSHFFNPQNRYCRDCGLERHGGNHIIVEDHILEKPDLPTFRSGDNAMLCSEFYRMRSFMPPIMKRQDHPISAGESMLDNLDKQQRNSVKKLKELREEEAFASAVGNKTKAQERLDELRLKMKSQQELQQKWNDKLSEALHEADPWKNDLKSPSHYAQGKFQPWDVVKDWKLDYFVGCAVKYICRHKHKGSPVEDIQKAIDYLVEYKKTLEVK